MSIPKVGVNIEPIGYWRGSTPFNNLVHQKGTSNIVVQKQPHLAGKSPLTITTQLSGTVPITPESALGVSDVDPYGSRLEQTADLTEVNPSWRHAAKEFDFLRLNATALRLNEDGGSYPNITEHWGLSSGISAEGMAALQRETGRPLWWGPGHLWNSAEILEQVNAMVQSAIPGMHPGYFELSNETWNGAWPQGGFYRNSLGGGDFGEGLREYSRAACTAYDIAVGPYAVASLTPPEFVLGAQFHNPWTASTILDAATRQVDCLAVAPYFGKEYGETGTPIMSMTDEQVFAHLFQLVSDQKYAIESYVELAHNHGAKLVAYEGGPHLFPIGTVRKDQDIVDRLNAIQTHPLMTQLLDLHLTVWKAAGGDEYCAFSLSDTANENGYAGIADFTLPGPLETPKGLGIRRHLSNSK